MTLMELFLIAAISVFSIIWIINYIPLERKIFNKNFSPRLLFCKLLAPFDAMITIILISGSWLGISTAALGIGMMTYNAITGLSISIGVLVIKNFFVPKWKQEYKKKCQKNIKESLKTVGTTY